MGLLSGVSACSARVPYALVMRTLLLVQSFIHRHAKRGHDILMPISAQTRSVLSCSITMMSGM